MATILANPCLIPAIPYNGIVNLKIVDSELIIRHLDRRFIVNLGVSYHDLLRKKECTDEELVTRLTLHSYNDRLAERRND